MITGTFPPALPPRWYSRVARGGDVLDGLTLLSDTVREVAGPRMRQVLEASPRNRVVGWGRWPLGD